MAAWLWAEASHAGVQDCMCVCSLSCNIPEIGGSLGGHGFGAFHVRSCAGHDCRFAAWPPCPIPMTQFCWLSECLLCEQAWRLDSCHSSLQSTDQC